MIETLRLDEMGFGQDLPGIILDFLEKQLGELGDVNAKVKLDSWHRSFQAARAMFKSRLNLSRRLNEKLAQLSFFSDLIPSLLLLPDGDLILKELLTRDFQSRKKLQRESLEILAANLAGATEEQLACARMALQHILEQIFGPLRSSDDVSLQETFQEVLTFVLDILDNQRGLFRDAYELVTPAMGASAMQALLEVIQQRRSSHPKLLQVLSDSFNCRVEGELQTPVHHWIEWPDIQLTSSLLPYYLYTALCTPLGREWLQVAPEGALQDLHQELRLRSNQPVDGMSFASVRAVAFLHSLLDASAAMVAKCKLQSQEAI